MIFTGRHGAGASPGRLGMSQELLLLLPGLLGNHCWFLSLPSALPPFPHLPPPSALFSFLQSSADSPAFVPVLSWPPQLFPRRGEHTALVLWALFLF